MSDCIICGGMVCATCDEEVCTSCRMEVERRFGRFRPRDIARVKEAIDISTFDAESGLADRRGPDGDTLQGA